ncbi:phosphatidylinositol phosphate synthase [Arsenicicoccus sp. oral taxon 190]|uniref:phosphatidylinositol phosphate synthase n=1 Tax=Arsenicicoccus sp. oral taxon 190 TaxID=1658671 RepID=UPI00067A1FA5|nr:CDP-alcohol phosphatidyltransferase family protein [Arsenicicoccus sp. oral taxon 190]AKT51799.1 CDP-alcohol phosphatidyltransferase [Arsenicicoccus sp. oral taxon 190]
MLNRFRSLATRIFTPVATVLLRLGVSPDAVTIVGTLGVAASALWFFPRGEFLWGTLAIVVFVFSDTIDGVMARHSGRTSSFGAFLDSSLDRIGDAAIFGGLLLHYAWRGDRVMTCVALAVLVLGLLVSYVRARAEGLGMTANVGIAERADRLVLILVATFVAGLGLGDVVVAVALWVLALASAVTVLQRILAVRRQALG